MQIWCGYQPIYQQHFIKTFAFRTFFLQFAVPTKNITPVKYKLLFFISLISILSWQCQRKPYTPENLPDLQLRFGDGGGFTGAVTTFTLLTNGQLFKYNSFDNTHLQISQLPAKEAK
ncbi:MAG: hypothetical protein ACK4TA_22495, partial [Saprospiraceae bacterium]